MTDSDPSSDTHSFILLFYSDFAAKTESGKLYEVLESGMLHDCSFPTIFFDLVPVNVSGQSWTSETRNGVHWYFLLLGQL